MINLCHAKRRIFSLFSLRYTLHATLRYKCSHYFTHRDSSSLSLFPVFLSVVSIWQRNIAFRGEGLKYLAVSFVSLRVIHSSDKSRPFVRTLGERSNEAGSDRSNWKCVRKLKRGTRCTLHLFDSIF